MYNLVRVSPKHWYLFPLKDIEFRGSVGILGPTGSGKSTLIDAIQAVISGGNHNKINLNASAEGTSERTLLDYCLGYLVPKKDGGEPEREASETILALTFAEERPDGTVHYVSAGLVMTGRLGDSREVPVSRFIVPGFACTVEDWKGQDDDGTYVKTWDEIAADMKRRCPAMREYRTKTSERFVSDLLAEMRPNARQPDARRFLNAFFNALAFEPIKDTTAFVRDFILERDDLDIGRVRARVATWKGYVADAQAIEKKIEILKGVARSYEHWGRSVLERVTYQMRRACAAVERRRLLYASAGSKLNETLSERREAEVVRQSLQRLLTSARDEIKSKRATLAEKGLDARIAQLDAERKLAAKELDDIQRPVNDLAGALRSVSNLTSVRDHLPGSFIPVIAAANAALQIVGAKPGLDWLSHGAADVARHLSKLKSLASLPERLEPQKEALADELAGLRRRREQLEENVRRSGSGGAVISRHTQALMRLLKEQGIEAVPLCDVVEVEDESWQFAAEALLGLRREALIVDPAVLSRANEILYRNRNSQDLHLCRLVKTTRAHDVDLRVKSDSIASVLRAGNRHAEAYIVTHLGGCRMAENEEELERANRAIMRNGKATASLDYQVHRDRDFTLLLGRTARERSAAAARQELEAVQKAIGEKQGLLNKLTQAATVAAGAATYEVDLASLAFQFDEARRKARDIENRRGSVLSEADRELADEIEELEAEITVREKEIEALNEKINGISRRQGNAETDFTVAKKELKAAVRAKRAAIKAYADEEVVKLSELVPSGPDRYFGPANPFYGKRMEYAGRRNEALAHYKASEDEADAALRERTPEKLLRMAATARTRMLENYCQPNGIERPYSEEAPYHYDYTWVVRQLERLEKNELREHLDRIAIAEKEMASSIKEDLLSRLTDKFDRLRDQLNALNAQLQHHEFTGQIYQFGRRADPAFDKMRRLAIAVKENPDNAQAIIEKRHDDPVLKDAMESLEEYIEAKGGAGLEDYRNYYSFDLYMVPKDQVGVDPDKARGRMSLSARVGVASGGEAQAPFYVAMAASMAMAYYPGGHPGPVPSGMGLVIFDEAFNRLDVVNTQSLIRFYASLGLQLLVAAPEGERPTFTEVFDTIVTVSKSEATKTVYIASDFPKERARQELAAINPGRKGIEGFRAELQAASLDSEAAE